MKPTVRPTRRNNSAATRKAEPQEPHATVEERPFPTPWRWVYHPISNRPIALVSADNRDALLITDETDCLYADMTPANQAFILESVNSLAAAQALYEKEVQGQIDCGLELGKAQVERDTLKAQLATLKSNGGMFAEASQQLAELRAQVAALTNYIEYLKEADAMTAGFLHAHNWQYPPEFIAQGEALRVVWRKAAAEISPPSSG